MLKDDILKGVKRLEGLPPSQWNVATITGIKAWFLPRVKDYVEATDLFLKDSKDIVEEGEKIFETKSEPVTSTSED